MTAPQPGRFHADRPRDLRRATSWHRLSYIVDVLPERLERLARELPAGPGCRILDYGCADQPYRRFFGAGVDYVGADLPGNPDAAVIIGSDGTLPLPDASVDAVLSTQVLEHVTDPALYLAECARVLRPGGRVLLSTHGLMVYHPDPIDYWRWTSAGLRHQVERAGLEVLRFEGIMGLTATGLQLVQDAWYWRVPRLLRNPLALLLQSVIRVAERFEVAESRDMNALVFALVAEKS
jgi:SAM-dependent methyltransferase